jgi:hypothetical protein
MANSMIKNKSDTKTSQIARFLVFYNIATFLAKNSLNFFPHAGLSEDNPKNSKLTRLLVRRVAYKIDESFLKCICRPVKKFHKSVFEFY